MQPIWTWLDGDGAYVIAGVFLLTWGLSERWYVLRVPPWRRQ